MASPERSTPTTSGRVAGIVAIAAIVLGGYFGFIARPSQKPEAVVASTAPDAPAMPAADANGGTAAPAMAKPATTTSGATALPSGAEAGTTDPAAAAHGSNAAASAPSAGDAGAPASVVAKPAGGAVAEASPPSAAEPATPAAPTTAQSAPVTAATPDRKTIPSAPGEPTQQAALSPPPAPASPSTPAGAPSAAPSFDVVRVEPSGSAVLAGQAEPKSHVDLLDGSSAIASAEANDRGEWTIVLDKPLGPGPHDLSIRTTSADRKTESLSEQHVAIDVPKSAASEPLVVLDTPDAPSRVIQKPAAPATGQQTMTAGQQMTSEQKAATEQKSASAEALPPPGEHSPPPDKQASAAPPEAGAPDVEAAPSGSAAPSSPDAAATAPGVVSVPAAPAPDGSAAPGLPPQAGSDQKMAAIPSPAPSDQAPASSAPTAGNPGSPPGSGSVAVAPPVHDTAPDAAPADKPAASAVPTAPGGVGPASKESSLAVAPLPADRAGTEPSASAGQTDAKPEPKKPEPKKPEPPRPEPLKPEPPKSEPPKSEPPRSEPPKPEAPKSEPAKPTPAKPAIEPKVTVEAVEFENGKLFVAGGAATGETVRVYLDDAIVGEAKPGDGGRWLLETQHDVTPGRHSVRADQVGGAGQVVVRAEVPFDRSEDVAELAPVTAGGAGTAGAAGKGDVPPPQTVIIRRGDNLWRISRRLYGRGIHYSTIYQANDEQIRNPHWIYPGQVFTLPVGNSKG